MSCLIVALVIVVLQLMPTDNLNSIILPSNIAEQEAEIPKPSNMVNPDKDLMLAEDDDTTNIDSQNRLIDGKFDKNIKLVGNK